MAIITFLMAGFGVISVNAYMSWIALGVYEIDFGQDLYISIILFSGTYNVIAIECIFNEYCH